MGWCTVITKHLNNKCIRLTLTVWYNEPYIRGFLLWTYITVQKERFCANIVFWLKNIKYTSMLLCRCFCLSMWNTWEWSTSHILSSVALTSHPSFLSLYSRPVLFSETPHLLCWQHRDIMLMLSRTCSSSLISITFSLYFLSVSSLCPICLSFPQVNFDRWCISTFVYIHRHEY